MARGLILLPFLVSVLDGCGDGSRALDAGVDAARGDTGALVPDGGGVPDAGGRLDASADAVVDALDRDGGADAGAGDGGASLACDPEARPTPNGGLDEASGVGGCPPGMVAVDTFCVDRYEASLVLVGAAAEQWSPYWNPGDSEVRAVSLAGAVPQGYISGTQAASACARSGKRLCTDAEWLRACRGAADQTYPYGGERIDGLCNDARDDHPAIEYFGTTDDSIWSMLSHPCLNQLPDGLARTGAHAECVTDAGIFDMMGNLHEWTANPEGTFRGGFYVDTVVNGNGCEYVTTAHSFSYSDYSTGFRCCADR